MKRPRRRMRVATGVLEAVIQPDWLRCYRYKDTGQHVNGDFSVAVVQANKTAGYIDCHVIKILRGSGRERKEEREYSERFVCRPATAHASRENSPLAARVPTLGRRFLLPLDPVRPHRFMPNRFLPASNRPPLRQIGSFPRQISLRRAKSPCLPYKSSPPCQITANPPKLSPNRHKNPRRQERRQRPQRDGRKVQEDNCTGASGIPMADGSTRPATSSLACPSGNGSIHPAAGHPFHVCKWLMVTTTTTTVHGGLLPTVLARWGSSTERFFGSRFLVDTARWNWWLSSTYTPGWES